MKKNSYFNYLQYFLAFNFCLLSVTFSLAAPALTPAPAAVPGSTSNNPHARPHVPAGRPAPPRTPLPKGITFELRDIPGSETQEIWAKWPEGSQKVGETMILAPGTPYFHWSGADFHEILEAAHGFGPTGFENLYRFTTTQWEAQGPGLYASLSPMDSSGYGPQVLMGKSSQPIKLAISTSIFQSVVDGKTLGSDVVGVSERLRRIGLQGLIQGKDTTWVVFIKHEPVSNLVNPTGDELLDALKNRNQIAQNLRAQNPGQVFFSQAEQEVNPITGVQTFYQKGYLKEQAPNEWTRKNAPEWDKLLRGETLTDAELAQIAASVQLNAGLNSRPQALFNGLFSKDDPHFLNVAKFFEDQAQKKSTPEIEAKVSDFLAQTKTFDDTMAAYTSSAAYRAYQIQLTNYFNSTDYKNYIAANNAYPQSAAYQSYQNALNQYQATPAYQDYLTAQKAYRSTQAYQDFIAASHVYSSSPAYQHWINQVTAAGGTFNFAANPPPPAPTPPPGAPALPPGQPTPPPRPIQPPMPVGPAAPQVKLPNVSELSPEEALVYNYRGIANAIKTQGKSGPFLPTPPPTRTPKQQAQIDRKIKAACLRRHLDFP